MSKETLRTYQTYKNWKCKSKQTEYTEETPLLASDGTLLAKGWARHNVFDYNRDYTKKGHPITGWSSSFLGISTAHTQDTSDRDSDRNSRPYHG